MKRERKTTLTVYAILCAFIIFTIGLSGYSGCSGCSGCSKNGKNARDNNSGIDISSSRSEKTLQVTIYAYCPCATCNTKKWKGMLSTGQKMNDLLSEGKNICAADPNVIPMGSIVTYNNRDYIVADTGGMIKGNTINIFLESHKEVNAFGVKKNQTITYRK